METKTMHARIPRVAVTLIAAVLISACGLDKQTEPSLIGPAEGGLSITMTAAPDQLPRDGSSQSVVTLIARDSTSRPIAGQRLALALTTAPMGATLSQGEVTTNSDGIATFAVSAPIQGSSGNAIVVSATAVGTNADNARARRLSITVNPPNTGAPTANFRFSPAAPEIGQVVTFDALSTGSPTIDEGVTCNSCSFTWNFGGDGDATGSLVTHTFTTAGAYVVSLTAVDTLGNANLSQQTVTVTGTSIPTGVSLTSSPAQPIAKQQATFTANATPAANHRIVSYQFIWGDGDTSTVTSGGTTAVIQHAYSQADSYMLTLTVRDDLGQSTTINHVVTVSSGLTPSFTTTKSGTTVTFDASASASQVASTITDYAWDFDGDGSYDTNGTNPIVSHDFGANGTYRVTLRVTDSRGVTDKSSQTVTLP